MTQVDEVQAWREAHERVCELVTGVPPEAAERRVPACPDWTVRDLLSHVVGLGADVLAGDEPDDHNETWTQAQVDARRDRTVEQLVAEWRGLAGDLEAWMRAHGTRPLGDVTIHEQDLRSALGVPGARDTGAFAAVRERMVGRFASRLGDLPPIALVGGSWTWTSDGGPADAAAVVVNASDFDLGRALMSRRTAQQLRSWTTRGDLAQHLGAFEVLGPLPEVPLPE
ncbi:MAG: hypothetical protein JWR20_2258 [Marmoricola sp.]|nr:hypothetical protein [Marmoricola sp.]